MSPTVDCEKPATKPSAACGSPLTDFSNRMAATPLLSPLTCVLLPSIDVPWTANHVNTPMLLPSDARLNRRSVSALSTSSAYWARSSAGLARYAQGLRLRLASGMAVVPKSRKPLSR